MFLQNSLLILAAISTCIVASADENEISCLPLPSDHYCRQFMGFTHGQVPNVRNHPTIEAANREFNDFLPLLKEHSGRGCHSKLGTLLCFVYFPWCDPNPARKGNSIKPCRELCEDVTASEDCTALIRTVNIEWSDLSQFNCSNNYIFKDVASRQCANGTAPAYNDYWCDKNAICRQSSDSQSEYSCTCKEGYSLRGQEIKCTDIDECASGSHGCHKNASCTNTEGSYTCTCNDKFTGNGFHCEECSNDCRCRYRTNAGGKTFKNNCFCFAARVTVLYYGVENCMRTITVNVTEQFNVMIPYNNTVMTAAPDMVIGSNITINIGSSSCDICHNFTLGGDYLIAGTYEQTSDKNVNWKLPPGEKKSLVSKWDKKKKYTQKLKDWIKKGNNHRKDGNHCVDECSSG